MISYGVCVVLVLLLSVLVVFVNVGGTSCAVCVHTYVCGSVGGCGGCWYMLC